MSSRTSFVQKPIRAVALALPLALVVPAALAQARASGTPAPPKLPAPALLDQRLQMTLVAAEPDLVTPIGVAVDRKGRVFVLESHTHFPPKDYALGKHDVVKVFEDRDGDGTFETRGVYADGFIKAMHLAFAPGGKLLVAQRDVILALEDRDGDGKVDARGPVVTLDTVADYPHNGIGSLAVSPDGWLIFGMGENFGETYTLRGRDGRALRGGGEGGNVYRIRPDGSRLARIATGFWNPFGLAFYGAGAARHLLVVDNDPDARPPNRLLDVIEGADFGFRFRHGRNGIHPFIAWDGELPGTLPMAGAVGEAASAILATADTGLPADLRDTALVTSWGDHRIEAQRLRSVGATLRAEMNVLVKGGEDFRPVGLAAAPDGSVFITDWVDKSYPVHGKGRLWRLHTKTRGAPPEKAGAETEAAPERARLERLLAISTTAAAPEAVAALGDRDPFVRTAAVAALSRPSLGKAARRAARSKDARVRLGALLALRRSGEARAVASLPGFLDDPDEEVRIAALIWAAEDRPLGKGQANLIDRAVARPRPSARLLRIYAAAAELLGVPLAAVARPPGDEALVASLATAPAGDEERRAQDAAVWRLAASGSAAATEALRRLALDRQRDPELRVDAVAALAMLGAVAGLGPLGNDPSEIVKKGAHRALRQQNAERVRPSDEAAWRKAVVHAPGDPRAGRRVFFHPGVGCARCHRVDGVGGVVGPDLSTIGRGMDREKLFTSIYAPSREIAPENATRIITTKDGRTFEGLLVHEPDGAVLVKVASGEPARLTSKDIASDLRSDVSLMPEGLQEALTEQDFRDLLAFLAARK